MRPASVLCRCDEHATIRSPAALRLCSKSRKGCACGQESIAAGGASLIGSGYSLTRAALATTCGKTLGLWCKRSNPTEARWAQSGLAMATRQWSRRCCRRSSQSCAARTAARWQATAFSGPFPTLTGPPQHAETEVSDGHITDNLSVEQSAPAGRSRRGPVSNRAASGRSRGSSADCGRGSARCRRSMAAEVSHEPCHCIQGRIQRGRGCAGAPIVREPPWLGAGNLPSSSGRALVQASLTVSTLRLSTLQQRRIRARPGCSPRAVAGRRRRSSRRPARSRLRPSSVGQPVSCARVLICSTTSSCSGAAPTSIPLMSMRRCSAAQTPWVSPKSCRRRPPAWPRTVGRYRGRLPGNDRRRMVRPKHPSAKLADALRECRTTLSPSPIRTSARSRTSGALRWARHWGTCPARDISWQANRCAARLRPP